MPSAIVRVRRAGEQVFVEARQEFVGRLGEIARDLLLDRALLVRPLRLRVVDVLHARGIEPQRDVEVGGGHGREVLRDVLLRVGVAVAAELREDRGRLIGRQTPAQPRNAMCSCACAMPGKPGGVSLPPTR